MVSQYFLGLAYRWTLPSLTLLFLGLFSLVNATPMYVDKVIISSDKRKRIRLTTRAMGIKRKVLLIENSRGLPLKGFTLNDLRLIESGWNVTTAGYDWYQNVITFFSKQDSYFYIFTRWGRVLIVDLRSKRISRAKIEDVEANIRKRLIEKTLGLLESYDEEEKFTGAIFVILTNLHSAEVKVKELFNANPDIRSWLHSGRAPQGLIRLIENLD